jgi:hypothetical protein
MYSLKKLESIAEEWVHSKTNTMEGVQNRLTSWFCFTFNTTPNDQRLLNMTLEELIIFYLGYKIYNDSTYFDKEEKDDYEEFLKQQMGNSYISEEEMIAEQEKLEKQEQEKYRRIKDNLPEKITTDFSQFEQEE